MANIIKVWWNRISINLVRNKVRIQISKFKKRNKNKQKYDQQSNNSTKKKLNHGIKQKT